MSTVITVENLGKKYTLHHQQREQYTALRDVIANTITNLGKKLFSPSTFNPQPSTEEFFALKDVSFEVKQGDRIGIIGRNGAGKSTLLKILSRITEPTTGSVRIKGRVASLLEVGTGFHPELTGRENIFLNGAILGMGRAEIKKKFDEIVYFAEIEKFLDTPVKRYSSGMYVRLAFAVAAHLDPEILIVDEVLAVGDAQFQKKCLGKMEDVSAKEGRTVLFVSHNMGAVSQLCEKGLLMVHGQIALQGNMRDIINEYMSENKKISTNTIDLSTHNHGGHQEFSLLRQLSIFSETMMPCTVFEMGQTIIFRLMVDIANERNNVEIGLKISNLMDMAIHYYVSSWEGMKLNLKKGTYTFEIKVPNIHLFPGKYLLGAWVLKDGHWSDDNVSGITIVEIISKDITGNFHQLNIKNNFDKYVHSGCEVYAPSSWSLYEQP
jgi:lipopolysaccharide transport system ATP-binding protein